jgi:predicted nucleic acid-binding protein
MSSSPSSPSRATQTLPDPSAGAVVLDTDVASLSFRNRLPPRLAARLVGRQPLLSFVTVGELTKWTKLRHWGPRNTAMLDGWLSDKPVIPGSRSIAAIWGNLSATANQRGRPRPVNDTWIAACCLAYDLPLATLNLKDFKDFAEHHGLRLLQADGLATE